MVLSTNTRPRAVTSAVTLLYIIALFNFGLGVLSIYYSGDSTSVSINQTFHLSAILGGLLWLVLALFFIYLMGKGKNWARIIIVIFLGLNIVAKLAAYLSGMTQNPKLIILGWVIFVLEILVIILLFLNPSNDYFRKRNHLKIE